MSNTEPTPGPVIDYEMRPLHKRFPDGTTAPVTEADRDTIMEDVNAMQAAGDLLAACHAQEALEAHEKDCGACKDSDYRSCKDGWWLDFSASQLRQAAIAKTQGAIHEQ